MTNRELIEKEVTSLGYVLGCYNEEMEKLPGEEINKVIEAMEFYDHTDVDVRLNNKDYVVELATVDNEKDFNLLTKEEYVRRYGKKDL